MAKKQTEIPGTERERNKEIEDAAESYVEARDDRMKFTEVEVERRDALVAVMEKYHLQVYRDETAEPPLLITLSPGVAKVKVTRVEEEDEEEAAAPRVRRGRSAAAASAEPLEAEADRILANAGDGALNDPSTKGAPARHKRARTRSAKEVGATQD